MVRAGAGGASGAAVAASGGGRLWRSWTLWVTGGECLGFVVPAVVAVLVAAGVPAVRASAFLAAGAIEGAVLGAAQVRVLRRVLPRVSARGWVLRTSLAAVVAWSIGLVPTLFSDEVLALPAAVMIPAAVLLGSVLLVSIGVAQWTVLRHEVRGAGHWVWITAVGWGAGLAAFGAVTSPLWQEGQAPAVVAAVGVLGGVVMAAVMAAATGAGLVWLLRR